MLERERVCERMCVRKKKSTLVCEWEKVYALQSVVRERDRKCVCVRESGDQIALERKSVNVCTREGTRNSVRKGTRIREIARVGKRG